MKRLKTLLVASVFALLTIGAAGASAQYIYEEPVLIELPKGINGGDDNQSDDIAPATETPDDPEGERAVFMVGMQYTIGH